jgi:acetyl esterase/lipase
MATFTDHRKIRKQAGVSIGKLPDRVETQAVDAKGVSAEWVRWRGSQNDAVILYLHGGGYVFGGLDSHRGLAWRLAKASDSEVLVVDYRLAPEHLFPAAVDDAIASYQWLLAQGVSAERLIVAGDSAGGGLAVALMIQLKKQGLPQPKAAVLLSPWTDLSLSGESVQANAQADAMLSPQALKRFRDLYLGDGDPVSPLASPLFGDLAELSATYVVVGSHEVLRDDSERFVEKLKAAGGQAQIKVWSKMPHVFPLLAPLIPEGAKAIEDIADFIKAQLQQDV